jgi:L-ascorbate metabolism protein UlaG (beta-lactamase superfamily)
MEIERLTWASVLIKSKEISILIDPLGAPIEGQERSHVAKLGEPLESIISLQYIDIPSVVLVTHTHPDHFDYPSILKIYGDCIPIYVPKESSSYVKNLGFRNVVGVLPNEEFKLNHLTFTASNSVDGFGSPQVSWVISDGVHTLIHCGDTQWHGHWWQMEQQFGPIQVACLPVNGPILEVRGLKTQSRLPACLTPEEAVEAAKILEARYLVPIHYKTFNNPPYYCETDDVEGRLLRSAKELAVKVKILRGNEHFSLDSDA